MSDLELQLRYPVFYAACQRHEREWQKTRLTESVEPKVVRAEHVYNPKETAKAMMAQRSGFRRARA